MHHTLILLPSFIFVSRLLNDRDDSSLVRARNRRRSSATNQCLSIRQAARQLPGTQERANKLFHIHLLMPSSRREVGPDRPSLSPKREPIRGVRATLGISAARESMADPCPGFLPLTWASKRRGGGSPADEKGAQCSGRPSDSSSPAEGRKGR